MLYVLVFVFVNSRSYVVRISVRLCKLSILCCTQGRIQDFKLGGGGGALKKIAPSGGRREHFWGISCEKSRFNAKFFFPILGGGGGGGGGGGAPLWIRPWK